MAVYAIHRFPGDRAEAQWLVVAQEVAIIVAIAAGTLWTAFYSGLRPRHVFMVALAFAALFLSTTRVGCKGDMQPTFSLRDGVAEFFGVSRSDELERDLSARGGATSDGLPDATPGRPTRPEDWPGYRGAERTGLAQTTLPLLADWRESSPKRLWRHRVGGGYGAFAVAYGRLYSLEQRRGRETVACYAAASGNELWAEGWDAKFDDTQGGPGPRSTPAVWEGRVYAYGAAGHLACLDASSGKPIWQADTLSGRNKDWGLASSPLIVEGSAGRKLVVVQPGAQEPSQEGRAVVAFDALSGETVWQVGTNPAGYSSPSEATLVGVRQLLIFDGRGLAGLEPTSGRELWRVAWRTMNDQGINVAQPIVLPGDKVFIASGYGVGAATFQVAKRVDGTYSVEQVVRGDRSSMRLKFASALLIGDGIFGLNDGVMECVDAASLETRWKDRRRAGRGEAFGHGQLLGFPAEKRFVAQTESGELAWLAAEGDELKELGRVQALDGNKSWNNPAFADGFLYVRNDQWMACYSLRR